MLTNKKAKRAQSKNPASAAGLGLQVKIDPWGPPPAAIEELSGSLLRNASVRSLLRRNRHRLISMQLVNEPEKTDQSTKSPRPTAPDRYRATIFDYTANRAILIDGSVANPKDVEVTESSAQPLPSEEEFRAAVAILIKEDPELGTAIQAERVRPYRPMPPLIELEAPDGRIERTFGIGLLSADSSIRHRVVGVNMVREQVVRDAPGMIRPSGARCGPPVIGGCASTPAAMAKVTISQGGTTLWTFIVAKPNSSSGTNGSGIELRYVDYRGQRVLYQAHVPILNVEYFADGAAAGCGPTYRDWLNSEDCFQAVGADPVPGFRLCTSPAQTIIQTGSDAGNFQGVGVYVQGHEGVLVSEMQAGWYRYVSEWRFDIDGTIRPRFAFAGTDNACTCKKHHHHVYWRLDFDIRTPGNNLVEEYNKPPLIGTSSWHKKRFAIRRPPDTSRKRKWRVTTRPP